jgi:hypothetical protein
METDMLAGLCKPICTWLPLTSKPPSKPFKLNLVCGPTLSHALEAQMTRNAASAGCATANARPDRR